LLGVADTAAIPIYSALFSDYLLSNFLKSSYIFVLQVLSDSVTSFATLEATPAPLK
jgi:hypothetical protein